MATIDITERAPHSQPSWFYSAGAAAAGVLVGFGLGMTIQSQTVALPAVAAPLAAHLPVPSMPAPSVPSPVVQGAVALPVFDPAPGSMPALAPASEGLEPCWSDQTQVRC